MPFLVPSKAPVLPLVHDCVRLPLLAPTTNKQQMGAIAQPDGRINSTAAHPQTRIDWTRLDPILPPPPFQRFPASFIMPYVHFFIRSSIRLSILSITVALCFQHLCLFSLLCFVRSFCSRPQPKSSAKKNEANSASSASPTKRLGCWPWWDHQLPTR